MKEDYLWDKSGEVDAEIEQLEKTLGSLRYKRPAEPLPLPAAGRSLFRFNSNWLAAAAAIALLLLAGGLWLGLNRAGSDKLLSSGPPPPVGPVNTTAGVSRMIQSVRSSERNVAPPQQDVVIQIQPAVNRSQFVAVKFREAKRECELRQEEIMRRGEIAKEQLIKALEITSEKLNIVQKKIQGAPDGRNPIS
jgi:hypothetical protein